MLLVDRVHCLIRAVACSSEYKVRAALPAGRSTRPASPDGLQRGTRRTRVQGLTALVHGALQPARAIGAAWRCVRPAAGGLLRKIATTVTMCACEACRGGSGKAALRLTWPACVVDDAADDHFNGEGSRCETASTMANSTGSVNDTQNSRIGPAGARRQLSGSYYGST